MNNLDIPDRNIEFDIAECDLELDATERAVIPERILRNRAFRMQNCRDMESEHGEEE